MNVSTKTIVELSRTLDLIALDVCGVELNLQECENILQYSYETLLTFYMSVQGGDIGEISVNCRLKEVYIDI